MSKNIAIFLDGTWNDKDDKDELSNVALMHDICVDDGVTQVCYYDKGVGTEWYDKKIGGLVGAGLSRNICQAYQFICETYSAGDRVFIFGFSRGAYTARSLSGLLSKAGLLANRSEIPALYEVYRDNDTDRLEQSRATNPSCPVEFLGVWDTVGALGIPLGKFIRKTSARPFEFHDTVLSADVKLACHAVSIDERRSAFEPTLWKLTQGNQHRIRQVWFAGVHSDVGGGYPERHHSAVALHWMIQQVRDESLTEALHLEDSFDEESLINQIDLTCEIHDSAYKIFGIELGEEPRRFDMTETIKPTLHISVKEKMRLCPHYRPVTLTQYMAGNDVFSRFLIDEERAGVVS